MLGGLVAAISRHIVETVKLKAYAIALYAVAAVSLLYALTFAVVALRLWLFEVGTRYPDVWIALGFVVIAGALLGVGYYMQHKEPASKPLAEIALIAGPPAAGFALRRLSPKAVAIGVVLIAGLFVGRRLTHRSS
jgi:hypothetical protein